MTSLFSISSNEESALEVCC